MELLTEVPVPVGSALLLELLTGKYGATVAEDEDGIDGDVSVVELPGIEPGLVGLVVVEEFPPG